MAEWWADLDALRQVFLVGGVTCTGLLAWQLVASLTGADGGDGGDHGAGDGGDHDGGDGGDGESSEVHAGDELPEAVRRSRNPRVRFRLLTFRSILAFATLFSWGMFLYPGDGTSAPVAALLSTLWGAVAMVLTAGALYGLRRATEDGTARIESAIGAEGTVYLDIPPDGQGQVRVRVGEAVAVVKARGAGGQAVAAGTPVLGVGVLEGGVLEVQPTTGLDEIVEE